RRQLVVEDDDVDAHLPRRRGEQRHFAGTEKRRRVWLGALLQNAKDDFCAGGFGETGQFVERSIGVEAARAPGNQPNQGGAFARLHRSLRHARTCSHGTAPARTRRGRSSLASMTVDAAPPIVFPASSNTSMCGPSVSATISGSEVAG